MLRDSLYNLTKPTVGIYCNVMVTVVTQQNLEKYNIAGKFYQLVNNTRPCLQEEEAVSGDIG